MLDGTSTAPARDAHLVYDATGIRYVGRDGRSPPPELLRDAQRGPDGDFPDHTLLPGLIEAHAHLFLDGGELDAPMPKQNAWTYAGDRKDCFYVVGRRCFKTQKAACTKACGSTTSCKITGAGPAAVSCNRKKG